MNNVADIKMKQLYTLLKIYIYNIETSIDNRKKTGVID